MALTIAQHLRSVAAALIVQVLFGVALSEAVAQDKAPATTPEDAVRTAEFSRREALLDANTTALSTIIADEFVEISRFGQIRSKADNLRDIASGALKLLTVNYEDLAVRVYGDVAVLTGVADNTGTLRGTPFSGKVRYTRVFVRRDARWQAVLMQQTSMP